MWQRFYLYLKDSASYIWIIPLAIYFSVSASQAVIKNYQSQEETKRLQTELDRAKREQQRLEALLIYFRTENFKEKELRRSLLLIKPGEKAYALHESGGSPDIQDPFSLTWQGEVEPAGNKSGQSGLPNWRKWLNRLF